MDPQCAPAHRDGSATHGPPCVVGVTVRPAAWVSPIGAYAAPVGGEKRQVSMLNFTAAPSSGVPSWNVLEAADERPTPHRLALVLPRRGVHLAPARTSARRQRWSAGRCLPCPRAGQRCCRHRRRRGGRAGAALGHGVAAARRRSVAAVVVIVAATRGAHEAGGDEGSERPRAAALAGHGPPTRRHGRRGRGRRWWWAPQRPRASSRGRRAQPTARRPRRWPSRRRGAC